MNSNLDINAIKLTIQKKLNINKRIVTALVKRDIRMYFTNPTGYVFITLFIFLSAAAAFWQERFFLNNLANLELLNNLFPYLLLFFIPALTMGVWADERRQGTDELLLTIPAADLEIVLGKYIAALGVYTASLIISLSHMIVLCWLGSPDLGLMFSNYIGFWLIGAAFISIGMVVSLLSPNITVGFIAGAIFCSLFTYLGAVGGIFGEGFKGAVSSLTVFNSFADFSQGVISFSGLVYFISLTGVMLYGNVILLGRRHWPIKADGYKMWVHYTIRTVSIIIAIIALNFILGKLSLRLDVTREQLHSLSSETHRLIKDIPSNRKIFIHAYVSKDVPQIMVQTRENLMNFLREIDALGGNKIDVIIRNTEPYSAEAREAREKFNISPQEVLEQGAARSKVSQVFMGVAFTCGAEEEIIPFFDKGLPVEYELVRSIRVVAKTLRKRIGILDTEARIFGGLDFKTFQSTPEWQIVSELKKQYDVIEINPSNPIPEDIDGLLVVMPSTLPQPQMDELKYFIESGKPTLILDDPLPLFDLGLAPVLPSGANRNPFMNQGAPPEEKGNISELLGSFGILWNASQVSWDTYNPHPEISQAPPEFVFMSAANKNAQSFAKDNKASAKLQEVVLLFPGTIQQNRETPITFTPLLKTDNMSGILSFYQLVQQSFLGIQLVNPRAIPHIQINDNKILAVHVAGLSPTDSTKQFKVIFISDVDFIADQFFNLRRQGIETFNFDNVTFFLNCIDVLVGDESFIDLRSRRVKHRTLEAVESKTSKSIAKRMEDEQNAEKEAQDALNQAQLRLNEKVAEIDKRTDLDLQTKQIMAQNVQEVENRKFEALKQNIETEKKAKIEMSQEELEAQIQGIQSNIKMYAVLVPPIPVIFVGIMIFLRRSKREREGAASAHRLRG